MTISFLNQESQPLSLFAPLVAEGKYTASSGTANCVDCPSGKFAEVAGSISCNNCDEGTISVSGASSCENCPSGKTSKPESLYRCSDCEAGQFSTAGSTCLKCPNGKYTSFSSSSECLPCRSGYYCQKRNDEETIGSSNPEEYKCGHGQTYPASFFCPEGSSDPTSVQAGYFSTPADFDDDIRQDEDSCDSTYFCARGKRVAFMKWADGVCGAVAEEINEGANPSVSKSFQIGANKNSDGSDILGLAMTEGKEPTYEIMEVVDKGTDGTCNLGTSDVTVTSTTLSINGNVDYESCSAGITVVIEAEGDFSASNCYDAGSPCSNEAKSELCYVDVRILNQNESPYWHAAQTSDKNLPCYMNSITFSVDERLAEYTEFGDNLETCVADPDEADAIKFTVEDDGNAATLGDELFDVRTCGGKLFVRPAATGEDSKLRYHMVSKTDAVANDAKNLHQVTVTATDNGLLSATETINVQIVNVNDPPTWCSDAESCTVAGKSNAPTRIENVLEREPANTIVFDMSAHAEDLDWDDLTFAMVQNDDDAFRIDSLGVIRSNVEFDFESKAAYYISVSVTDGDESYAEAVSDLIKVEIKDINDPPYFNNGDDGTPRNSIEFEFAETVPDESGETTTNGPTLVDSACVDSDLVTCDRNDDGDIIADISSLAGDQDASDSFSSGTLRYVVLTEAGTVSDDFGVVTTGGGKTELKVTRATDDGANGNPFDYEGSEPSFKLKLYVQDQEGKDSAPEVMVGPIDLILKLVDINEKPVIPGGSSVFSVVESSCDEDSFTISGETMTPIQNGDVVGYIEALDVDIGQEIFMFITGYTDGSTNELPFIIDPVPIQETCSDAANRDAGYVCWLFKVKLTGTLDHETKSAYGPIGIKVSDGQKEVTSEFTVNVIDCNEGPVLDPDGVSNVAFKIYEDASSSNPLANLGSAAAIKVSDVDDGDSGHSLAVVGGSGQGVFEIDNDGYFKLAVDPNKKDESGTPTGELMTLDYETVNTYYIQVVAYDQQNGEACAGAAGQYCFERATSNIVTYTVDVLNRNERPEWASPDSSFDNLRVVSDVTEKASNGDRVHKLEAYDQDMLETGLGDTVTYTISQHSYVGTSDCDAEVTEDNTSGDPKTNAKGQLCCVKAPFLSVEKSDTDDNIVALAIDWNSADHSGQEYPLQNLDGCELMLKLSVTDAGKDCDTVAGNDCSDYDATSTSPLSSADEQTIIFSVTGSNFSPDLKDKTYGGTSRTCNGLIPSVCINENPSEGQVVVSNLTHITTDLNNDIDDETLWQKHSYEIINQKQSFDSYNRGRFEINNKTGAIIVTEAGSKSLDYELVIGGTVENVYEILVRVTDNGDPILGDVATITIQLSDVNEPPTFNRGTGRFEVDEVRIGVKKRSNN